MPKFYDENNNEIISIYDEFGELLISGKGEWYRYWKEIPDQRIVYDKAYKIFEDSIELKSYVKKKQIVPHQIEQGFYCKSYDKGRVVTIKSKQNNKIVITKILNDEEFKEMILRKKRQKRKKFIDKALANKWTHWCTLTFSPEIAGEAAYSYTKAKQAFMEWRKSIVRKFNSDVKYMAIAEYGSNDERTKRIHWHVLLYFDKQIHFEQAVSKKGKLLFLMRKSESGGYRNVLDEQGKSVPKLMMINWKYGISDFYPIYNKSSRAVYYMAKYMTKSDESEPYEEEEKAKSFLSSKGLKKPQKEYLLNHEKSELLEKDVQNKIEAAPPTFKLKQDTHEVMRKMEAIIDSKGNVHALNKKTSVINIQKKSHQSQTTTSTIDDN